MERKRPIAKIKNNGSLSTLRFRYFDKLDVGDLNINFLASKFDELKLVIEKVDILGIIKTKLFKTFPSNLFSKTG